MKETGWKWGENTTPHFRGGCMPQRETDTKTHKQTRHPATHKNEKKHLCRAATKRKSDKRFKYTPAPPASPTPNPALTPAHASCSSSGTRVATTLRSARLQMLRACIIMQLLCNYYANFTQLLFCNYYAIIMQLLCKYSGPVLLCNYYAITKTLWMARRPDAGLTLTPNPKP
jgi:hypothetical protein